MSLYGIYREFQVLVGISQFASSFYNFNIMRIDVDEGDRGCTKSNDKESPIEFHGVCNGNLSNSSWSIKLKCSGIDRIVIPMQDGMCDLYANDGRDLQGDLRIKCAPPDVF